MDLLGALGFTYGLGGLFLCFKVDQGLGGRSLVLGFTYWWPFFVFYCLPKV